MRNRPGKSSRSLPVVPQTPPPVSLPRHSLSALCRAPFFAPILLGLLLLAAYANSFGGGFIVDNQLLILKDPRVQSFSLENLRLIFTQDYWWPSAVVGVYRPVAKLTYLANWIVPGGGPNPVGYHFVNLLLQWGNAVLLFFLLRRVFGATVMSRPSGGGAVGGDVPIIASTGTSPVVGPVTATLPDRHTATPDFAALFGAALFAVHPVSTEAVANIIGRTDLLAGMAVLGALLCFIRALEAPPGKFAIIRIIKADGTPETAGGWRKAGWLAGMSAVVALGLLCKENAVTAGGVILLYALTFLPAARAWRECVLACAALAPAYLAVWALRSWVAAHAVPPQFPFVDNPLVAADFWTAKLTAFKVIGHYFLLLVWPAKLSCDYSYNQIPVGSWNDPGVWGGILAVVATVAALIFAYRRCRPAFFLGGFACLVFLPTTNLFFNIGNIMGERYLYVSLAGVAGCVALVTGAWAESVSAFVARRLPPFMPFVKWGVPAAAVLLVTACGVRTFARNPDWHDSLSIWSSAVRACPESCKAHKAYASALYERDPQRRNMDAVITVAEHAREIMEKGEVPQHLRFGGIYADLGAYYVEKAEVTPPTADNKDARDALYRRASEMLGQAAAVERAVTEELRQEAIRNGQPVEKLGQGFGDYHIYGNLGLAQMRLGNQEAALAAYQRMHGLAPAEVKGYLGAAFVNQNLGRTDAAIVCLLQALLLDNGNAQNWCTLFALYRGSGLASQAVIYSGGTPQLDMASPLVKRQLRDAYLGLARNFETAGNASFAAQLRAQAEPAVDAK